MYSALAGFVEPGETIEEAVRREIHEEARIDCGAVRYVASQPWPFPSSLMIGCLAEARSRDIVIDGHELEDARWFTRDEVEAMFAKRHPQGITAPDAMAIAHHILRFWLERRLVALSRRRASAPSALNLAALLGGPARFLRARVQRNAESGRLLAGRAFGALQRLRDFRRGLLAGHALQRFHVFFRPRTPR